MNVDFQVLVVRNDQKMGKLKIVGQCIRIVRMGKNDVEIQCCESTGFDLKDSYTFFKVEAYSLFPDKLTMSQMVIKAGRTVFLYASQLMTKNFAKNNRVGVPVVAFGGRRVRWWWVSVLMGLQSWMSSLVEVNGGVVVELVGE
nr:hypothetical protein [Tanacetum cinerariifolium]